MIIKTGMQTLMPVITLFNTKKLKYVNVYDIHNQSFHKCTVFVGGLFDEVVVHTEQ
jgi:hypothetical protein